MHAFVSLGNGFRSMTISPESGAASLSNDMRSTLHVSHDPRGAALGSELSGLSLSPKLVADGGGGHGSPSMRGQRRIDEFMWSLAKRPGVPTGEGKTEELHDHA